MYIWTSWKAILFEWSTSFNPCSLKLSFISIYIYVLNFALFFAIQGELGVAEEHYKKALELEPSNDLAAANLQKLRRLKSQGKYS